MTPSKDTKVPRYTYARENPFDIPAFESRPEDEPATTPLPILMLGILAFVAACWLWVSYCVLHKLVSMLL